MCATIQLHPKKIAISSKISCIFFVGCSSPSSQHLPDKKRSDMVSDISYFTTSPQLPGAFHDLWGVRSEDDGVNVTVGWVDLPHRKAPSSLGGLGATCGLHPIPGALMTADGTRQWETASFRLTSQVNLDRSIHNSCLSTLNQRSPSSNKTWLFQKG